LGRCRGFERRLVELDHLHAMTVYDIVVVAFLFTVMGVMLWLAAK